MNNIVFFENLEVQNISLHQTARSVFLKNE